MADTPLIGGGRPMRTCIGCGQTDDHPRCVIDLGEEGVVTWHMDCHFIAHGPQPCHPTVDSADGPTGAERLVAIQAADLAPEPVPELKASIRNARTTKQTEES